jgi:uncharacterized protein involved in exopolysaccharide biosynthesis
MTENTETTKKSSMPQEIDLIEVIKKIWDRRKIIFYSIGIFLLFGIFVIIGTPKEYKSEVTVLVETGTGAGSMTSLLQQFGGLAGLNLSAAQLKDALTPQIYPDIIKSTPFLIEIMNQKVYYPKKDTTITVFDYLDKYNRSSLLSYVIQYTIGLPFQIIGWIKDDEEKQKLQKLSGSYSLKQPGYLSLNKKQTKISKQLLKRIRTKQGETFTTLTISVEMQDALIAAQVADSLVNSLTKYIIDYRTQKALKDLEFINDRYKEAEEKFLKAQKNLAEFRDQNKNIILSSYKSEEEKLQAEYNLAFNVYNTLAQQLEQAKIKVQERTPVLKVIDPAKVALTKSKPKISMILFAMLFLGLFVGIIVIFSKVIKLKLKNS